MSAEKSNPLLVDDVLYVSANNSDGVNDSPSQTQSAPNAIDKAAQAADQSRSNSKRPKEINGPAGLEPTRYGDWEAKGRCYDF